MTPVAGLVVAPAVAPAAWKPSNGTLAGRPYLILSPPRTPLRVLRETAPAYGSAGTPRGGAHQSDADDELTSLGEEIMTLAQRLHAETYRWLALIAEFDRREGWKLYGFGSCAEWLAFSTRLDKATAREKVRVARKLSELPETSAGMERGELSFSQVRALTRVADEESELELLAHARSTSASGLERLVRSWRRLGREDEAELDRRRHESRCLSVFPDDQGMYLVRGRLDPEVAALLMRAIEAASDALYRGSVPETTPEQRRVDALALLAERALAAGFGGEGLSTTETADEDVSAETSGGAPAIPLVSRRSSSSTSTPTTRSLPSQRYMVVLHVDSETLKEGEEPGRSDLEDGTRVSAETSRRLACDASVVRVTSSRRGAEVRVEGRTRTVPPHLRRALEVRDRGCRFPGCGSRFTDAHHVRHWADGGATRLENLILLCRTHHRLLHEGGFSLRHDPSRSDRPTFFSSRGIAIPEVPPKMTWRGEGAGETDVPMAVYLRALEALG